MSRRVLVVSNQPPPLPGVTTAGPGLRAYSIARPLAIAGHDVTLVFPDFHGNPPPSPGDAEECFRIDIKSIRMRHLGDFLRLQKYDFVILTNFIQFRHIVVDIERRAFPQTKFIYDLFAPKILENRQQPGVKRDEIEREINLKGRALRASNAILVNGRKKIPYATAWLLACGADTEKPLLPTNFAIQPQGVRPAEFHRERHWDQRPIKVAIAGDRQPWTSNRLSSIRLLQTLADNNWALFSCGRSEFAKLFVKTQFAERFASLRLESFSNLPFDAFCEHQASCDIFLDVFTRTRERELAYVTRTAVALSNGLPVIHPRWTETGDIVREFAAGWLYENEMEIPAIIEWITNNPTDIKAKISGAVDLQKRQMNETFSTLVLRQYIEDTPKPEVGLKLRKQPNNVGEPLTSIFLHNVFDPEWYAVQFGLPLIEDDVTPADYFERFATAERSAPNFLLSYVQEMEGLGDLRLLSVEQILSALEGWLDVAWLRKTLSPRVNAPRKNIIVQYFRRSRSRLCDPNRFFSESFYANYYPEVVGSLELGAFVNGYDHYLSVGQRRGFLPSPFFCAPPQDSPTENGHADTIRSQFREIVRFTDRTSESPTPFFDLEFWRRTIATGSDGEGLGYNLIKFIDCFSDPDIFGSEFHRDIVTSELANSGLDEMRRARNRVLEQVGAISRDSFSDLRDRIDAHVERNIRNITEMLTRSTWALRVLSAYQGNQIAPSVRGRSAAMADDLADDEER